MGVGGQWFGLGYTWLLVCVGLGGHYNVEWMSSKGKREKVKKKKKVARRRSAVEIQVPIFSARGRGPHYAKLLGWNNVHQRTC
jgi:hypothetical protein